jgi:hypothetical protein
MGTFVASTGNVTRRFGTFSAEVQIVGSSVSAATTTMLMAKMPKISQDFDVQESSDDISKFRVNLSKISISIFDKLGNGNLLFTTINQMADNDTIQIKTTVPTGSDFFIGTKAGCKYDRVSRKVTIEAQAALRYDVQVTNYGTGTGNTLDGLVTSATSGSPSTDANLITSSDAIKGFLLSQGSSPTTKIIGHKFTETFSSFSTAPVDGTKILGYNVSLISTYANAQTNILTNSIIEGAFVGSMMGFAFYVRRNFNVKDDAGDNFATLSASNFKDFGTSFNKRNVSEVVSETVSAVGTQDVILTVQNNNLNTIKYSSSKWQLLSGSSTVEDSALTDAIIADISTQARDSYKKSLGIATANEPNKTPFLITLKIFGIGTLKPYQFIEFGSDIHPSVNGLKARPSMLEYDLENDIINCEAYLI